MKKYHFDYLADLIVISAVIYGDKLTIPRKLTLALDTASTKTIFQPGNIELIGYSEKDKTKNVGITTGSKTDKGFEVKINKMECIGEEWINPKIIVKNFH